MRKKTIEKSPSVFTDTDKKCPKCKINLQSSLFHNTEIDYCQKCLGIWFDEDELRLAKDDKIKSLNWLDIDIWEDEKKFKIAYGVRACPYCRVPLYEVYYGDSKIVVDVCSLCKGIWLDRGEFKKIVVWLKKQADYEVLHKYVKNLLYESAEVFIGPESMREELEDLLTILKLLGNKLSSQHPKLAKAISTVYPVLPK